MLGFRFEFVILMKSLRLWLLAIVVCMEGLGFMGCTRSFLGFTGSGGLCRSWWLSL